MEIQPATGLSFLETVIAVAIGVTLGIIGAAVALSMIGLV